MAFSANGSQIPDNQLRRENQQGTTSLLPSASQHVSDPDTVPPYTGHHLMSESIADQLGTDTNGGAIHRSFDSNRHGSLISVKRTIHSTMSATDSDPRAEHISLADQYLDTMVMDERWRALCIEAIRTEHQWQRLLKRANMKSTTRQSRPSNITVRPGRGAFNLTRKIHTKKLESTPPTPPISPRVAHTNQPCSTRSDSGFISSSPSPAPPAHLRLRSTRNCPAASSPATISIDISPSMIGRTCLSCGSSNTTCWRRTLGGIICNSCGLRLAHSITLLMVGIRNAASFVPIRNVATSLLEAKSEI